MEPFGLFQILQSFLSQNPETAQKSEEVAEPVNLENTEPTSSPPAVPQVNAVPEDNSTNQAILSFMQAHEKRAKRIKKS